MHDKRVVRITQIQSHTPAGILYSKLTIETLEQCAKYVQNYVKLEHISNFALVFILLTLNKYLPAGISLTKNKHLLRLNL